jgi:hypothetical protein
MPWLWRTTAPCYDTVPALIRRSSVTRDGAGCSRCAMPAGDLGELRRRGHALSVNPVRRIRAEHRRAVGGAERYWQWRVAPPGGGHLYSPSLAHGRGPDLESGGSDSRTRRSRGSLTYERRERQWNRDRTPRGRTPNSRRLRVETRQVGEALESSPTTWCRSSALRSSVKTLAAQAAWSCATSSLLLSV